MRITFVTRKFGNVERNYHCDVLHITPIRVARLFLDRNGDFAIKAYVLGICTNYVVFMCIFYFIVFISVMDRHFVLFIMLFLIINSTYFIVRGAAGPRGVNVP